MTFEPSKIDSLRAGAVANATAIMKASGKRAGGYVTTIKASTPEVNASAQFRISVRTPMLWGWVGVLITLTAIGIVIWLFRKYGRR